LKPHMTVLLSTLVACLGVSLFALANSTRSISHWSDAMVEQHREAQMASLRCDTLSAINAAFAARHDSTAILRRQNDSLQIRLAEAELARTYDGYYLIVDTSQNRFHLRRGDLLVRSGYVGTGIGWTENASGMSWDFSTPRGLRRVLYKTRDPYWYRPDWFWHEQNLTPPRPGSEITIPDDLSWDEKISYYNDSLTASQRVWVRVVPGALGSYALDLGNGILLHYGVGRGRNVSHGCIRLGTGDLEAIFRTLEVGSPVLIY